MHATDLVGINGITRVLLVHTCQQGVYPRGHILPLRLPFIANGNKKTHLTSLDIFSSYLSICCKNLMSSHLVAKNLKIKNAAVTFPILDG
jgi:hypothetical protein